MASSISITGPRLGLISPLSPAEACLAAPAFRALAAAKGADQTIVLCLEPFAAIWTLHFENVVTFSSRSSIGEIAAILAEQDLNTAVFTEDSPAARATVKAGIANRLGPREKSLSKILTDSPPSDVAPGPPRHRVTRYLRLAEGLSCPVDHPEYFTPPPLPPRPITPLVGLVPDSDLGPAAEWPDEHFLHLAKELAGMGFALAVLSAPGKGSRAREFSKTLKSENIPHDLHVDLTLPDLTGFLPALSTLVASHGSLSHLAAHVGLPVVNLMGPFAPVSDRPLGKIHESLTSHAECSPCLLARCPLDHRCLRELAPDAVVAAVLRLLPA